MSPTEKELNENPPDRSKPQGPHFERLHPMTLDALARHEDEPATEHVPEYVRSGLSSYRLIVTTNPMPPDAHQMQRNDSNLGPEVVAMPEGSFVGIPVQEMERHALNALPQPADDPKPHRPEWLRSAATPRISGVEQVVLRRRNGNVLIGTDSGRVYGEYPARTTLYPSAYPWACIGRLFVWTDATAVNWSRYGSATLIGPRAILTAGHMVPWGSGSNWKALFVAGYYDAKSASGPGGQSWVTNAHGWNSSVAAHDMAVMRLSEPLGNWIGYFGTKAYADNWQDGSYWTLVGYPTAVTSERPSFQTGIRVLDDDEDGDAQELEHHGDDTGGDSGGPFFGFWSGKPYAIGTVSGYEVVNGFLGIGSEDNNIVAGGGALNAIVHYARDNWP